MGDANDILKASSPTDSGEAASIRRKNVTPVPIWVLRLDLLADGVKRLLGELDRIQQDVVEAESQFDLELTAAALDAVAKRLQIIVDREHNRDERGSMM